MDTWGRVHARCGYVSEGENDMFKNVDGSRGIVASIIDYKKNKE